MMYRKFAVCFVVIMMVLSLFSCKKKNIMTNTIDSLDQDHSNDPLIAENVDIDTVIYEDKEGDVLYNIAKADQIILPERYVEKYPKMADVIAVYNAEKDAEAKSFIDVQKQEVRTMRAERNDDTLMLSSEDIVTINRIDDIVFSFKEEASCYLGGAHGSSAIIGRNYKANTGEELTSSEIFTNTNKLKDILIERIKEEYGEEQLFPEWIDTLNAHFDDKKALNILVGREYVDVIFDQYYLAPYSTGIIIITLPYKAYSDILNKKYFR